MVGCPAVAITSCTGTEISDISAYLSAILVVKSVIINKRCKKRICGRGSALTEVNIICSGGNNLTVNSRTRRS
jgi:hypothetical protein